MESKKISDGFFGRIFAEKKTFFSLDVDTTANFLTGNFELRCWQQKLAKKTKKQALTALANCRFNRHAAVECKFQPARTLLGTAYYTHFDRTDGPHEENFCLRASKQKPKCSVLKTPPPPLNRACTLPPVPVTVHIR